MPTVMARGRLHAAIALFLVCGNARAQSGGPSCGAPWVRVSAVGSSLVSSAEFVRLLRAELAARHVDVCEAGPGDPIATIDLSADENGASLDVEVRDAITAKRVRRDVALSSLPADGVPLALAQSADELLRASWAELAIHDAPPPRVEVPAEVTRVNEESIAPRPRPDRVSFALAGAVEHYRAGTTLFGVDVAAALRLASRARLGLYFGARGGSPVQAHDGQVDVSALTGGLEGSLTATPPTLREGLDVVARAGVAYATFTGTAGASGRAMPPASDWALLADAGVRGWLAIVPALRVAATLLASVPVRPVQATDGGASVSGIGGGIGVAGSLGLVGSF